MTAALHHAHVERMPLRGSPWVRSRAPNSLAFREVISAATYRHERNGVTVISALQLAEAPDGSGETIPQWHLSISRLGKRPSDRHVRRVLKDFGVVGAEEDNHHPGIARQFWVPVDPARRVTCQCSVEEETVVEPDGYRWTNPREGACRGCEYAAWSGKLCPIHSEMRAS